MWLKRFKSRARGLLFELVTYWELWSQLDRKLYTIHYDLTVPDARGFTQIDFVVEGPTKVFVIECKWLRGKIYGREWDKTWTQVLGGKKYKFQNPIRQNYRHVKAIARHWQVPEERIESVVYFGPGVEFVREVVPSSVVLGGLTVECFSEVSV